MANVLAAGLLIGRRRLLSCPFLLGFEVAGATVLALYVAAVILFGGEWLNPYLRPVLTPVIEYVGRPVDLVRLLILCCAAAVVLSLPQLVLALAGGFVFRRKLVTHSTAVSLPGLQRSSEPSLGERPAESGT